jgi:hypothetical protein
MPHMRVLTRPSVWLLTVALALAGLASTGATASAAEPIHITGTVTGTGGVPLANVEVQAIVYCGCEGFSEVGAVQTADDGTYDLAIGPITDPMLSHNTFYLHFDEPTGDYAPEYYNNAVSVFGATGISVADGATASGKDVRLKLGGRITGTVTGPGGSPLAGVFVHAYFADPNDSGWLDTNFYTKTADDGTYDLSPLPARTYNLEFSAFGDYRGEWYPTDVVVRSGTTVPRRDARLSYRRHVANLKRPAITGKPKVGRPVTAGPGSWNPVGVTTTYRWLVAGRPVAGATHASYTPRAADVGKTLRVRVTATATGHRAATATSPGKTVAKRTLKVSPRTWSP